MFNSLKYAKKLEDAGVTREQAEAHVQILTEVMETNFATKHDFIVLENAMSAKFEAFDKATGTKFDSFTNAIKSEFVIRDKELDNKVSRLENRMLLKGGLVFSVGLSLLGAFLKLV